MCKATQGGGPVNHRSSILRYGGIPESAKRILHREWPLKSLASTDQGLTGLCEKLFCISVSVRSENTMRH